MERKFKTGDAVIIPNVEVEKVFPGGAVWGRSEFHNPGDKGEITAASSWWNTGQGHRNGITYRVKCNDHFYWYREKDLVAYKNIYQPTLL